MLNIVILDEEIFAHKFKDPFRQSRQMKDPLRNGGKILFFAIIINFQHILRTPDFTSELKNTPTFISPVVQEA